MTEGPGETVTHMRYSQLGTTGIRVSSLCFGTLALSAAQRDLPVERAASILQRAWDLGVNFFDTAELYGTYRHLKKIAHLPGAVIASRSYASTASEMRRSLDLLRRELDRDIVDVFGLHEQESGLTLKGHRGALEALAKEKTKGLLGAVSVSTHYVGCVRAAAMLDEVDVIFAILNVDGLGIRGGSRADMEDALAFAKAMGKGVYIMKALGGGHLFRDPLRALAYARDFPHKDSVAVGLGSDYEVEFAAKVFSYGDVPSSGVGGTTTERRLLVEDWCGRCGECVRKCPFGALHLGPKRVVVDPQKCMLCGYCARVCPHFCLKVV